MSETERLRRKLASKNRTIERLSVQIITLKSKIVCLLQILECHQERMEEDHINRCRGDAADEGSIWSNENKKDDDSGFVLSEFTKRC
jgi:hypothetical protein